MGIGHAAKTLRFDAAFIPGLIPDDHAAMQHPAAQIQAPSDVQDFDLVGVKPFPITNFKSDR